jgi:hypothetical protein
MLDVRWELKVPLILPTDFYDNLTETRCIMDELGNPQDGSNVNVNRIVWRDFSKTRAYAFMQFVLAAFGYRLVVEYLDNGFARDCYIVQR